MNNRSMRTFATVVLSMTFLVAAISGGMVTYASFTDTGKVEVTFTAGNITQDGDLEGTPEDEGTNDSGEDAEPDEDEVGEQSEDEGADTDSNSEDEDEKPESEEGDTEASESETESDTESEERSEDEDTDTNSEGEESTEETDE